MNRILIIGIIIGIGLLLSSCKKDEEFRTALKFEEPIIEAGYTKADIRWNYSGKGTPSSFNIEYSLDPSFVRYQRTNASGIGSYIKTSLASLQDGQTYYVRCRAENAYSSITSDSYTFTTLACQPAVVHTDSVSDLTHTSARLKGTLSDWGSDVKPEVGFCYAQHEDVSIEDIYVTCGLVTTNNVSTFSFLIRNLPDSTTHYYRAYAKNATGIVYGEEMKFTTISYQLPSVSTGNITDITYTTAICSGIVTDAGGLSVTERGICYSTSPNPTISNNKVQSESGGIGSFSCSLSNLVAGTTYYIRAYATNNKGTSYGEEVSFSTLAYRLPIVSTLVVTDVSYTTATCGGEVTEDGGQMVIERGICYSMAPNPTIANNKIVSGDGIGSFSCNLLSLKMGISYYVRAYAINSVGIAYGESVSFATESGKYDAIYYTATSKLIETTSSNAGASGLHINNFNVSIISHDFNNGEGVILFDGTLDRIENYAFYGCVDLNSITIPNRVTGIGKIAFYGCTNLTSIIIPNGITSIEFGTFANCSSLTSITIPNSVTSIGEDAFNSCTSLTSITIPNGVTSIEYRTFANCSNLTSITIHNNVTSIGGFAFIGCSSLTSIDIPNSVTSIGGSAFYRCSSLTSITIPNSVTSIDGFTFYRCSNLTSIAIPNSVTSIGNYAFSECPKITAVTIGNSVTSIGNCAFRYCTSLTALICKAVTPPSLEDSVFQYVKKNIPLYVPKGSIETYKQTPGWSDFTNILPINE